MPTTLSKFNKAFSEENLLEIYENSVAQTRATGVDNISTKVFQRDLDTHLSLINRKVLTGQYTFTR
ncbi:MAG: hypothetical protein ACKVJE_21925, partial [Pseudomonadales bacterium]